MLKGNKNMNKKLQMLLANIALDKSPYGKTWESGPKSFEDSLIARGVKLPQHLYYKYKLPRDVDPEIYMQKLALYGFFIGYGSLGCAVLEENDQITQAEKDLIANEIHAKQKEYTQSLLDDAKELLRLNPNLRHLSINSQNVVDVLAGATFWYLPRNIEYFIDYKKRDINKEWENNGIISSFGIKESCGILAPEMADMVISALKEHANITSNKHKNR